MKKNNNHSNPNGRELAEQYLRRRPFSKSALIEQLLFDGCQESREIVENLTVDWDNQCERMALYLLKQHECLETELEEMLLLEGFPEETVSEVIAHRRTNKTLYS